MPRWFRPLCALCLLTVVSLSGETGESAADGPGVLERLIDVNADDFVALFDTAVQARAIRDNLPEPYARIAIRREIARLQERKESWLSALGNLQEALRIADKLADAPLLAELHVEIASTMKSANRSEAALFHLDAADRLFEAVRNPDIELNSALLRISLIEQRNTKDPQIDGIYQRLLNDDRFDPLVVQLHHAQHTEPAAASDFPARWQTVHDLAKARGRTDLMARALDQLGSFEFQFGNRAQAAAHFRASSSLINPPQRGAPLWEQVIAAYRETGDRELALAALATALAATDEAAEPARAALLLQQRAALREEAGDFAAAYQDIQHALRLRNHHDATRQFTPLTRMVVATSDREKSDAATLAATRASLRESELARTRLQRRQAYGIALTGLLAATALGIAYAYKRRTASALAIARDNAELRAERTHWQMLRYQLNPHFLFNALASVSGLVTTDTTKAARCVDRLTEFCHLALAGAHADLRTLDQEIELLRAYLDVEQAGAENLDVQWQVDPIVATFPIPPLMLQPLVENALKYGAQTSDEHLTLRIVAARHADGRHLLIEVANTGRWIEPDHQTRRRAAIGVANVRERLARHSSPGQLDFETPPGWVVARVMLPFASNASATHPDH